MVLVASPQQGGRVSKIISSPSGSSSVVEITPGGSDSTANKIPSVSSSAGLHPVNDSVGIQSFSAIATTSLSGTSPVPSTTATTSTVVQTEHAGTSPDPRLPFNAHFRHLHLRLGPLIARKSDHEPLHDGARELRHCHHLYGHRRRFLPFPPLPNQLCIQVRREPSLQRPRRRPLRALRSRPALLHPRRRPLRALLGELARLLRGHRVGSIYSCSDYSLTSGFFTANLITPGSTEGATTVTATTTHAGTTSTTPIESWKLGFWRRLCTHFRNHLYRTVIDAYRARDFHPRRQHVDLHAG